MKSTTRSLRALKGVRPIVCLTAYDVSTARIADAGGADLILVGDSLATWSSAYLIRSGSPWT